MKNNTMNTSLIPTTKTALTEALANKFELPKHCIHAFGRAIESPIQGYYVRLHADGRVTTIQKGWWDSSMDIVATAETAGGGWERPNRYEEFARILEKAQ